MSLINEALRKARQEAAERDANDRGVSYRPPRAHLPAQSKLGMGLVLGIVAGFAIAFAAAVWWLRTPEVNPAASAETASSTTTTASSAARGARASTPPPPASPPPPMAEAEPSSANDSLAPRPAPRTQSTVELPVRSPVPAPRMAEAPLDEPRMAPSQAAQARPQERLESSTTGTTVDRRAARDQAVEAGGSLPALIQPPSAIGQVADSNEFVLEADLGDVQLSLDFIVWSTTKPFAQINGRQVEVGQQVEGLLVEAIERDRVRLRGTDGSLVLRVR